LIFHRLGFVFEKRFSSFEGFSGKIFPFRASLYLGADNWVSKLPDFTQKTSLHPESFQLRYADRD